MFKKLLSFFGFNSENTSVAQQARRKYVRHPGFNAQVVMGDKKYNVHDWSMGGVAFEPIIGTGIEVGDKVKVEMQFHFSSTIITIMQDAIIVRSNYNSAAAEFEQLPNGVRSEFERVLENLYTQSFVESQIVS